MTTEGTQSEDFKDIKQGNSGKVQHLESDLNQPKPNPNDDIPRATGQNSPNKRNGNDISPSKSRNRRKNEARRRSANLKKQSTNNEQSERHGQQSKTSTSPLPDQNVVQDQNQTDDQNEEPKTSTPRSSPVQHNDTTTSGVVCSSKTTNKRDKHVESSRERSKEHDELKGQLKNQNAQIQSLIEQVRQQMTKIKDLDKALLSTTRTCNQLEKLLQQEQSSRKGLEADNASLEQTITRLKTQLIAHEKNKTNNDELVRVLNATLMERETEVSILKLKLTRMQTNPTSTLALDSISNGSVVKNDPCQSFTSAGRSNSEFDRNSYLRSSKIAEAASARAASRGSIDKNASIWAKVPEELTPSKRPPMLERNTDSIYGDSPYSPYNHISSLTNDEVSKPFTRDRLYKTLPRSMKSPTQELKPNRENSEAVPQATSGTDVSKNQQLQCQITNLDDSNSTNKSSGDRTMSSINEDVKPFAIDSQDIFKNSKDQQVTKSNDKHFNPTAETDQAKQSNKIFTDSSHYSTISGTSISQTKPQDSQKVEHKSFDGPPSLPPRTPSTPVKISSGLKKIFDKFRRSDSSTQSKNDLTAPPTPVVSPFKRGATRSTLIGVPQDIRAQMSPKRQAMTFQTDKPFSEWDSDMLVEWLTMIGLSMYTAQCRRWVKCGAHIMNATPAEVDRGLGITNHLHRKKLRLAISELNGDCDKVTKAAAKLDYLWVARWLDDIGLPQYKEGFINARVDGRVLNYLTIEDLVSIGVKSVLHHASIRCGIRVLRSIDFNLTSLKRRATAEELEQMNLMRQQFSSDSNNSNSLSFNQDNTFGHSDVPLWTCHRVMEWLRLIDFAEFAPNLRGSGVHGGLIVYENGFNIDTMYSILTIPTNRTLLRRHLSTFFKQLIGEELNQKKQQHEEQSSNQQLNPLAEIKTPKKTKSWFSKQKSSKVGQDDMEEYLCPMYPVEPPINKSKGRKSELSSLAREESQLSRIPESINV